uniref:Uncharacterized protein n=1 Tax=Anopheles christyi TaxID=43041 RepID=A0A182K9N4_9DIPT
QIGFILLDIARPSNEAGTLQLRQEIIIPHSPSICFHGRKVSTGDIGMDKIMTKIKTVRGIRHPIVMTMLTRETQVLAPVSAWGLVTTGEDTTIEINVLGEIDHNITIGKPESYNIRDYFHPSMLEDPWDFLQRKSTASSDRTVKNEFPDRNDENGDESSNSGGANV